MMKAGEGQNRGLEWDDRAEQRVAEQSRSAAESGRLWNARDGLEHERDGVQHHGERRRIDLERLGQCLVRKDRVWC